MNAVTKVFDKAEVRSNRELALEKEKRIRKADGIPDDYSGAYIKIEFHQDDIAAQIFHVSAKTIPSFVLDRMNDVPVRRMSLHGKEGGFYREAVVLAKESDPKYHRIVQRLISDAYNNNGLDLKTGKVVPTVA